ncbi:cysteine hydrolase family protein [Aliiroseovarius sp.]|uniref:cysteine hydrolase family protein n=1 Tax=Aliiroseovarius sp. TaxID=1872442 RepID=UPI003BA95E08
MIWLLLALAVLPLLWLAHGVWRISRVSRGAMIPPRPGTALLLVDLQEVFWDHGPYAVDQKALAEQAILAEAARARAESWPIIALRQEWSEPATKLIARLFMKGQAVAGTPGLALAAPFRDASDHELVKRVQDGFETGALDALPAELDVGHIRLVGLDGNYCVARTAQAARARGYTVTLVTDGVLAENGATFERTSKQLADLGVTAA